MNTDAIHAALSAEGQPWVAADNTMTRLSEPARRRRLGVPLPTPAERAFIAARQEQAVTLHAAALAGLTSLPTAFDLRNVGGQNYVTDVRDQASCGSCVAFGSVAVLETTAAYRRRQAGLELNLSEAHLFYTHGATVGVNCDTGWLPLPALGMTRDIGVTFEDYFPYTPGNSGGASLNADWSNRLARAVEVVDLSGDPAKIKEHLTTHGAVTGCIEVFSDFFAYRSGVYQHVTGDSEGGHCMAIVGYDDAASCWIVKNSWGPGWGDHGFVRIGYGQCNIEGWAVVGVTDVRLRAWTGQARVLGLWSNDQARNGWAYLENYGWHRLATSSDQTSTAMLTQAVAAKVANRSINAFADNGVVSTLTVL
jgi:C1A family cysteine protease